MKKSVFILLFVFLFIFSCGTFTVKTEVEYSKALSSIKKANVMIRVPDDSDIPKEEFEANLKNWLISYFRKDNISILTNLSEDLSYFKSRYDKFYQATESNEFLKYKSIGIINQYLQKNKEFLRNIFKTNNIDGLIIYEIYGMISKEMQFIEFDSVIVIINNNFEIVYLDHQSNWFPCATFIPEILKSALFDNVSSRLFEKLHDIELIGEQSKESALKPVISAEKDVSETKPAVIEEKMTPEKEPNKNDIDTIDNKDMTKEQKEETTETNQGE